MKVCIPDEAGLPLLGPVPAGVSVCVSAAPADADFWVPPFLAPQDVVAHAAAMPSLAVVQLMSAGADRWAGRLRPGVQLCDARGVHDSSTSEWVLAAILAYLRDFPYFVRTGRRWAYRQTDELAGKRILIVGAGSIGAAVAARLAPFEVAVTAVARRARPGEGVHGIDELPSLLPSADVVVVLVPLTPATTGLVSASFLAAMPDGALLVNAARGPVVDTGAILAETASGRLGYATDVTEPEPLPAEHPLWDLPNVLITPHVAGSVRGLLRRAYGLAGEQLRRFAAGEPLINVVVDGY
ncbi:2-hydroxyacid dehydrogenase [Dactylosporangium aurantiacum]|uniref:2-hydroxyacid dehydrogenase n=1 Tax=Dactylosporangium aurantiacum TaxID=35754 RepID=A0A9Q9MNR9_9ACTN|nr:2-hydroxyacid dehydrogenase [Dactylosporangium aurantiacum]MDG6105972.1 2-hydroxyacid dehydrogenase [Dactylosporangium aurantiacum]UWZ55977.1 2-hydroxyacid dehydrogenase [Dactylosporangium aurantiacum]